MSKKSLTIPANHTRSARQLADLATLLGLMQAASKLSEELDALANAAGGSLEKIAERFGVPFEDVHNHYVEQLQRPAKPRKGGKRPKAGKVASTRKTPARG